MSEPESNGDQGQAAPEFNWHMSNEDLAQMSEVDRAVYLNEKTSRLYDAITAMAAGEGRVTQAELRSILNPEAQPAGIDQSDH